MTAPYLSLILPVYNGARYIDDSIRQTVSALEGLQRPFEIIVVCDGSTDGTATRARAVEDPRVRVLHYSVNGGKGQAIMYGLADAAGRLVGWLDADLDIAPSAVLRAAERFDRDEVDAVVGSKRHPDADVSYPAIRRFYSWGFQLLARLLFRVNARDTQVGVKLFRREVVDTIAPLLMVKRYAFDLEVLAVGAEFGFDRVVDIPVSLQYRFTGSSINWRAVGRMLQDTLAIAYRIHIRHHYVRRFAAVQRERMDALARVR